MLLAQDLPAEALASVARARALHPEDADTAAVQAAALYDVNRLGEAEAAVQEALHLDPENVAALNIGAGVAALVAVVAFVGTMAGINGLGVAVTTVLLGGIAALWFTAFA